MDLTLDQALRRVCLDPTDSDALVRVYEGAQSLAKGATAQTALAEDAATDVFLKLRDRAELGALEFTGSPTGYLKTAIRNRLKDLHTQRNKHVEWDGDRNPEPEAAPPAAIEPPPDVRGVLDRLFEAFVMQRAARWREGFRRDYAALCRVVFDRSDYAQLIAESAGVAPLKQASDRFYKRQQRLREWLAKTLSGDAHGLDPASVELMASFLPRLVYCQKSAPRTVPGPGDTA